MKHLKRSDVMKRPPPQTKGEGRGPLLKQGGMGGPLLRQMGREGAPSEKGGGTYIQIFWIKINYVRILL